MLIVGRPALAKHIRAVTAGLFHETFRELFVLLAYWGIGQTHIEKDIIFGIDVADLEELQMRLRGQKRSHRTKKTPTQ